MKKDNFSKEDSAEKAEFSGSAKYINQNNSSGEKTKKNKAKSLNNKNSKFLKKDKKDQFSDDDRDLLREVFEAAFLRNRAKILRENFLRGIAFGFGTFLGGTIVIAAVVWILSFATDLFPWMDRFSQDLIRALEK